MKHRIWIWVIFALFSATLVVLRRPDGAKNPQFWAEDAVIFHLDAHVHGLSSLIRPHVGYFHTVPRLVAYGAQAFDPLYHPAIYNLSAAGITVLVMLLTACSSLPGGRWVSFAAALAFGLAPHTSHEVFLTITNIQWVLAPFLVVLLIREPPRTRTGAGLGGVGAFLAATTTPLSAVLVPLALWRVWIQRRSMSAWLVLLPLAAGGAVQLITILLAPGQWSGDAAHDPIAIARILGVRLVLETFLPALISKTSPGAAAIAGIVMFVALTAITFRRGTTRSARILILAALLGFFAATVLRVRDQVPLFLGPGFGDRYFYTMRVLLLGLLVLTCVDGGKALRIGVATAVLLVLISLPGRFAGAPWPDQRWADHAPAIRDGRAAAIPILPTGWTYHFPGSTAAEPGTP